MSVSLAAWLAATAGHFLLTFRAIGRTRAARDATADERAWMSMLASVGALAGVLHVLAVTIGVSLTSGLIALTVWHALLAMLTRSPGTTTAPPRPPLRWPEILALAGLFAVLFSWLDIATRSAGIEGADAAHYHVPNALNVALGASLFDFPATQHLYPMAGSVMAAWFIVPLGTPLFIDLAMSLAFLLTAVSINWMFRLATGLSGLAWASWLTLALFSTPLFRSSSLVSADLWFTAGFAALMAALTSAWTRGTWRSIDLVLAASALGLLVGSKTTGVAAAVLLLGTYGVAEVVRIIATRQVPTWPHRLLFHGTIAAGIAVASGGIWLIRNWICFGSPIAPTGLSIFGITVFPGEPLQPTSYLSVIGDTQNTPGYDVGVRTARYMRLWLGWWFLRALAPSLLVPLDLLLARVRRSWSAEASSRLMVVLLTVVPGAVLLWLLAGAPWTSLEWTRGFSLRYALPVVMAVALVAFVGLFPLSWRWHEHRAAAALMLAIFIVTAGWLFLTSTQPRLGALRYTAIPRADPLWIAAGFAVALLCWRVTTASAARRIGASILVLTVTAVVWVPATMARHRVEQANDNQRLARERAAPFETLSQHRVPYLAAVDAEAAANRHCSTRRFYVLYRFDLPLELVGPDFRSLVFYAARDVEAAARVGPIGPCDYVVAVGSVLSTDKGQALLAAFAGVDPLRQIPAGDAFLLFGRP